MEFVSNIIWNSVEGFVEAGTRSAGGYAGDALIKAGDMIENYGRGVGNSVEKAAAGYGTKIGGQTYAAGPPSLSKTPIKKALPSTSAKNPAPKRANSIATSKPSQYKTHIGAARAAAAANAKKTGNKAITSGTTARSTVGSVTKKAGAGVNLPKKELPKAYPNSIPFPSAKGTNSANPNPNTNGNKEKKDNLPKPYPGTTTYPGTDKKSAVRPGQKPKGFTGGAESEAPKPYPGPKNAIRPGQKGKSVVGDAGSEPKPYPGTTTYPGTEKKTAVKAKKYPPLERHKPPVEKGKMQHIAIGS